MSPQWYWKNQGNVHAPISTRELDRLFRQNRISDNDQFCLTGTNDWMSAAEVKALFAASNDSSSSGTTSESAARIVSNSPHIHIHAKQQIEAESWLGALTDMGGAGLSVILGSCCNWLKVAGEPLSKLATLLGRKTALTMLAVFLLAFLFGDVEFGDSQTQDTAEQFATTWGQIQVLQQREASRAEWKEFEQETLAWLQPTVEALEETANRNPIDGFYWTTWGTDSARAQREIYFAGVTLLQLLKRGQEGHPVLEKSFLQCMGEARTILTGEVSTRRREVQRAATRGDQVDPLAAGILVVDAVAIAGAGFWWWRRRQREFG